MKYKEYLGEDLSEICSKEVKSTVYYVKGFPDRYYSSPLECEMFLDSQAIFYDDNLKRWVAK